ncbi:hypothetical protein [Nocardioides sp. InS609-2]|uniref:hypothetical protein n=1 Tax=Nocardioides sp. InS609-2 TaxID=2760705 RepID=UPI0020BE1DA6|nr:hypothetical protein [Nocardioides sp. InS609-2]
MYTTENYLNAEIEYRANRVRSSWGGRKRRGESRDRIPSTRPVPGESTRTTR